MTGRPYRSRKDRPCDACRVRKVLCDMPHGAPCHRCRRTDQSCTFVERPRKRRRPSHERTFDRLENRLSFDQDWPSALRSMQATLDLNYPIEPFHPSPYLTFGEDYFHQRLTQEIVSPSGTSQHQDPTSFSDVNSGGTESATCATSNNTTPARHELGSATSSLEGIPGSFTFYIGPTGTSDAYLLRRQAFLDNNCTRNVATGLKFRLAERPTDGSVDSDSNGLQEGDTSLPPTVFGVTDYAIIDTAEPRADPMQLKDAWSELWKMVDRDTAWRLSRLYIRFVEPYFPVLAAHQAPQSSDGLDSMTLALLAGMCATAVPFAIYDEALYTLLPRPPSTQQLYRICWLALWQELHAPTLSTLQACLILQHRPPSNPVLSATAFQWSLMSTSVSVAQTIGLHREPASWHLVPVQERTLRRRLWWALYTMEKWFALARGMPSHISEEENDVEPLDTQDLEESLSTTAASRAHFDSLVSLTAILSEVQKTFYTVRATKRTSNNLHTSLEAARPLRERLSRWNEQLPGNLKIRQRPGETCLLEPNAQGLDANASLHLSYIATHMTLFRALLRPLDRWSDMVKRSPQEAEPIYDIALAVVKGAIICVKELVEFVEGLRDAQWNAFWHSWSRPNFAIAGSFMIHLLHIITPPQMSSENRTHNEHMYFHPQLEELQVLIKRWRWANRNSSNSAAGAKGLTNLGLFKVETLLASLGSNALPVNSS